MCGGVAIDQFIYKMSVLNGRESGGFNVGASDGKETLVIGGDGVMVFATWNLFAVTARGIEDRYRLNGEVMGVLGGVDLGYL